MFQILVFKINATHVSNTTHLADLGWEAPHASFSIQEVQELNLQYKVEHTIQVVQELILQDKAEHMIQVVQELNLQHRTCDSGSTRTQSAVQNK